MGRKRIDLGPNEEDRIRAMLENGMTPEELAASLAISVSTAKRRIREVSRCRPGPAKRCLRELCPTCKQPVT